MQNISLSHISLIKNDRAILDDVSFSLDLAKPSFVLGANGSGKSTLLYIIHGLIKPSKGKFLIDNQEKIDKFHQGFLFQYPVIFNRSVLDNMLLPLKLRHNQKTAKTIAEEYLQLYHLEHLQHQNALSLSGGEKQQLAFCRAMALQPKLLLLDEPTAHLDPLSSKKIENFTVKAIKDGVKIIFVSHKTAIAKRLAEQILFIDKGKITHIKDCQSFFTAPKSDYIAAFLNNS